MIFCKQNSNRSGSKHIKILAFEIFQYLTQPVFFRVFADTAILLQSFSIFKNFYAAVVATIFVH